MFRALAALLTLSLLAACGSDSPMEPRAASMAGRYELVSISRNPLPYLDRGRWTHSGYLDLREDGEYESSITTQSEGSATTSTSTHLGTWTQPTSRRIELFWGEEMIAELGIKADTLILDSSLRFARQ